MNGLALSVYMMMMSGSFSSNPENSLSANRSVKDKQSLQQIVAVPESENRKAGRRIRSRLQVADEPAAVSRDLFGVSPLAPDNAGSIGASFSGRAVSRDSYTATYPAGLEAEELQFVQLINLERAKAGLTTLDVDESLVQAARKHSRDMYDKYYFSHESADRNLRTPMKRYLNVLKHRPRYALVGENIAYCSEVNVSRSHKALMDSEGHRDNILDSRYDAVGIGVYKGSDGTFYATQMFLGRNPRE